MNELKSFFQNKKNLVTTLVLVVLLVILPLGVYLAKVQQIFFSQAEGTYIQLGQGNCVTENAEGEAALKCGTVPLVLYNPFAPSSPPPNENLIQNGSFETPTVTNTTTNNGWQIYGVEQASEYGVTQNIPGWEPRQTGLPYQVELHRNLYGQSADGSQYAEIDAEGKTSLVQKIATQANVSYKLTFSYTPRPDVGEQKLGVYWNGQLIDTITANGSSNPQGTLNWQNREYTVTGIAGVSTLGFGSLKANGAGNFIDKVSLVRTSASSSTPGPTDNDVVTPPPTTTPTASPTVPPTQAPVACQPRPNVVKAVSMTAQGLQVTVSAGKNAGTPNNAMSQINFTALSNGTVTIGSTVYSQPSTYNVPAGTAQVTFLIKQVTYGQATTINYTVKDSCGDFTTFDGGGTNAGWPQPTPAPVRCQPRPNIARSASMTANGLVVTLTGADNSNTPNNPLTQVKFTGLNNGTVTIGSQVLTSPTTVNVQNNTITFTIKQVTKGQATTVNLMGVDTCGDYPLFFGGGTSAGWP